MSKGIVRKGLPGGSFKPLGEEGIRRIHQAAMRIIEEVGFQVNSEKGLELFRKAGASIADGDHLVRLSQDKAMEDSLAFHVIYQPRKSGAFFWACVSLCFWHGNTTI